MEIIKQTKNGTDRFQNWNCMKTPRYKQFYNWREWTAKTGSGKIVRFCENKREQKYFYHFIKWGINLNLKSYALLIAQKFNNLMKLLTS